MNAGDTFQHYFTNSVIQQKPGEMYQKLPATMQLGIAIGTTVHGEVKHSLVKYSIMTIMTEPSKSYSNGHFG